MLWSAVTLAFFGCLRADELTINTALNEPAKTLLRSDLEFGALSDGSRFLSLRVKLSKTYPTGFTCTIGCSKTPICAYCSMSSYLHIRNSMSVHLYNQALFVHSDGSVLTHNTFVTSTKAMLSKLGHNPALYSGHSYRIGCASTAGSHHFRDWEVQLLGGWRSDTYKRYIRHSQAHAVSFAERLAQGPGPV